MDMLAEIAAGGLLALLIIREVFAHQRARMSGTDAARKRPITGPKGEPAPALNAVTDRLDRIIGKIEDIMDISRETRKQSEVNGDRAERLTRSLSALDETISRIEETSRRRKPPHGD